MRKFIQIMVPLLVGSLVLLSCEDGTPTPVTVDQPTATATPAATDTRTPSQTQGDTPTASPTATPTIEPAPPPLLPPNGVALFGRITGRSTGDTLRTTDLSGQIHDIRLESSSYVVAMVRVLPDRGELTVIETYTSPSYAKNVASPSTVDDRLVIVRSWSSGSRDSSEYNLDTLEALPFKTAVHFSPAVIGDAAYYYSNPSYDTWTGWSGQLEFVRESLTSGQQTRTTVGNVQRYLSDPIFWRGSLISAGQDLYGLTTPIASDPSIVVVQVDKSTGEPTEIATYTVSGFDDYMPGSWSWVFDNGLVYWVAARNEGGEIIAEIYWHGLEGEDVPQPVTLTLPEHVIRLYGFDVDDGYFVLETEFRVENSSQIKLILFDLTTRATDILDLGFKMSNVEIIHLGE